MNDMLALFFSPSGRIGRAAWWFATLVLLAISMGATAIFHPQFFSLDDVSSPPIQVTLVDLAALIPTTFITMKRLADRDWPRWPAILLAILVTIFTIGTYAGRFTMADDGPVAETIFVMAVAAMAIAIIADNGFMRGTIGQNRYGPDPLQTD